MMSAATTASAARALIGASAVYGCGLRPLAWSSPGRTVRSVRTPVLDGASRSGEGWTGACLLAGSRWLNTIAATQTFIHRVPPVRLRSANLDRNTHLQGGQAAGGGVDRADSAGAAPAPGACPVRRHPAAWTWPVDKEGRRLGHTLASHSLARGITRARRLGDRSAPGGIEHQPAPQASHPPVAHSGPGPGPAGRLQPLPAAQRSSPFSPSAGIVLDHTKHQVCT